MTLALVGAWAVAAVPSSPTASGDGAREDMALGVDAVQVPVTPDDGGAWADEEAHGDGGPAHAEYGSYGTRWRKSNLTYGFVNHTPDLTVAAQEAAIAHALNTWGSVTPLTFTKVADCDLPFNHADCETPDIRIQFGGGDHGGGPDDPDFDGPGNTAAHGFYPPPNGLSAAGDLHLDEAERWSTTGNGVDLQSVALHEFGHSLGLTHATSAQCPLRPGPNRPIMCGVLIGIDRSLAQDDVNGIQSIYGRPARACGGLKVTVVLSEGDRPTGGADVIAGTPGRDVINAGSGADIVCSGGGDDRIDLGPGNDRALSGGGNDYVFGRAGSDRIEAGSGNDHVVSGDHNDELFGGGGADALDAGTGSDELSGGANGDSCNGRTGRDRSGGCERKAGIELLF